MTQLKVASAQDPSSSSSFYPQGCPETCSSSSSCSEWAAVCDTATRHLQASFGVEGLINFQRTLWSPWCTLPSHLCRGSDLAVSRSRTSSTCDRLCCDLWFSSQLAPNDWHETCTQPEPHPADGSDRESHTAVYCTLSVGVVREKKEGK